MAKKRVCLVVAYDGTNYHGWQVQNNAVTIESELNRCLSELLGENIEVIGASRTDAGVHAEQMFAHFDLDTTPPTPDRLNRLLPQDIAVSRIFPVADDMHARFSAVSRTYEYRICTRKSPFVHDLRTYIPGVLDYAAMNEAAALLLGTHDFASFCKVHTDVKTTVCTVTEASWRTDDDGAVFTITADRFLRNMVRAVVGTLMEVGRHKLSPREFEAIISSLSRQAAGQSAPPEGLFLTAVRYEFSSIANSR